MNKLRIIALLILTITILALKPSSTYDTKPDEFGITYQEVSFETVDGVNLKGWVYRPETRSGEVVVISHDGDGNMQKTIEVASYFLSMGINVLTYDYRGYGESDAFKINEKFYIYAQFEKDLDAAIKFARNMHSITRVYLYGKGMGAGLSLAVGASSRGVNKVIADSPYDDLNSLQQKISEVKGEEVMIPLAYDKESLEPFYALATKDAKVKTYLLISGSEDPVCDKKLIKKLEKIQKDLTTTYVVKDAGYQQTFSKDKAGYFEAIKSFLK